MFLAPPPAVVVPDTVIVERTSHYDIKATDEPGIVKEMNQKGPAGGDSTYWAYTNGGVSTLWDTQQVGPKCVLVKPSVHVSINYVFPAWEPPAGVKPEVITKWNALHKAIVHHEGEHAQIARDQGNALTAMLRAHPTDTSCKKLNNYLQEKSNQLATQRQAADVDLDKRTSHGTKEGVAIQW